MSNETITMSGEEAGGVALTAQELAAAAANSAEFDQLAEKSPEEILKAIESGQDIELTSADDSDEGDGLGESAPAKPAAPPAPAEKVTANQLSDEELDIALAALEDSKGDDGKKVPLQALKEERQKRQHTEEVLDSKTQLLIEAERRAAYYQGLAEANKAATTPAAPAQADPVDTINRQIADVVKSKQESLDALYVEYDKGTMLLADMKRKEQEIEGNYYRTLAPLASYREQVIADRNRPDPARVHEDINSDPWLKEQTDKLLGENAWVNALAEPLFEQLKAAALRQIEAQTGRPVAPTVRDTMTLRQTIVALGKQWNLDKMPATAAASNKPSAEQILAKLDLANNHPPSINKTGASVLSEMSGEGVDDFEKLAALPTEELNRLAVGA